MYISGGDYEGNVCVKLKFKHLGIEAEATRIKHMLELLELDVQMVIQQGRNSLAVEGRFSCLR